MKIGKKDVISMKELPSPLVRDKNFSKFESWLESRSEGLPQIYQYMRFFSVCLRDSSWAESPFEHDVFNFKTSVGGEI